jgi:hypothetical protein
LVQPARQRNGLKNATRQGLGHMATTGFSHTQEPYASRSYFDLHDQLDALHDAGLLLRVDIPINKDTELHPLMRWQFRGGLDEDDRKAMLFTNVIDSKGKRYDIPVVVAQWVPAAKFIRLAWVIRLIS